MCCSYMQLCPYAALQGKVMYLNAQDRKMTVSYSSRLVSLLREVRQLHALK